MTAADSKALIPVAEVVDGPMEGLGLAAASGSIRIGRGEQSDLPLGADPWVSRRHVRIALEKGALVAEDEGGRNGTWRDGGRISGRVPLADGAVLLVGRTPVQAGLQAAPFDSRAAARGVTPGPLEPLLARTTRAAARDGRSFVDAFDLLRSVLSSGDAEVQRLLADLEITPQKATQATGARWPGGLSWIAEMTANVWEALPAGREPAPTPKVARVLAVAAEYARRFGLGEPAEADVLAALAAEPRGPVARALANLGIEATGIDRRLTAFRRPATVAASGPPTIQPTGPRPTFAEVAAVPGTPVPTLFELESWDVFREAKEIADRVRAVQALYHLADPDERRAAIEEALKGAFGPMVPERRERVLRHLADLFPLPEGTPALTDSYPEV